MSNVYFIGGGSTDPGDLAEADNYEGAALPGSGDTLVVDPSHSSYVSAPDKCSTALAVGGLSQIGVNVSGLATAGNLTIAGAVDTQDASFDAASVGAGSAITAFAATLTVDAEGTWGDITLNVGTSAAPVVLQNNSSDEEGQATGHKITLAGAHSGPVTSSGSGSAGRGAINVLGGTHTGTITHDSGGGVGIGVAAGGDASAATLDSWASYTFVGGAFAVLNVRPGVVGVISGVAGGAEASFGEVYGYNAGQVLFDGTYAVVTIGVFYLMNAACQPKLDAAGTVSSMKVDASLLPSTGGAAPVVI